VSELREIMRDLRNDWPSKVHVNASPPEVRVRLVWADLGYLEGEGIAKCHPSDTFDLNLGVTIAFGRAIKDAARRLPDDFVGDGSLMTAKTLGDYIPCDEQEAFALDREDHSGDDGLLEDLSTWEEEVFERLDQLAMRMRHVATSIYGLEQRVPDELEHLKERLAELEAGDGRRA